MSPKKDARYRGEHVYLVVWPDLMIVKAGYTSHQRWRTFMGRGAICHQLTRFARCRDALDYERELHDYFRSLVPFAFKSPEDGQELLRRGGHCETYRLDRWDILAAIPQPEVARTVPTNLEYLTRPVGA